MCRFIESICCRDGKVMNLEWHQNRVNTTFRMVFSSTPIDLGAVIKDIPDRGLFKCRIIYDKKVQQVHFQDYTPKKTSSLKLVPADHINYPLKYERRDALDALYALRAHCDDVIIVKEGLLTDSYYANIALFDGDDWYTPHQPLLHGTKRAAYISEGRLKEAVVSRKEMSKFTHISLINAMLDLEECIIPIERVID